MRLRSSEAGLRVVALAIWIACVVFVFVPRHGAHAKPLPAVKLPQPKSSAARGL